MDPNASPRRRYLASFVPVAIFAIAIVALHRLGGEFHLRDILAEFAAIEGWQIAAGVLLVGYSQGADTLPFMLNRLTAESRRLVKATALIAVSKEAIFEFHVTHWLGTPTGGLPTMPELEKGSMGAVPCVYGSDEKDSPCLELKGPNLHRILLPGGHHFNGDYGNVAQSILSALSP